MNEEQLTNAMFNAMIKFHAYQMEHFGEIMEKTSEVMVETLPKVIEAVESVID